MFGAWLAIVIVLVAILAVLVYKNANRKVYITQYDDKSGSQGMFYTITVSDGSLIVVDSGNPDNEEYVRQVLAKKRKPRKCLDSNASTSGSYRCVQSDLAATGEHSG